MRGQGYDGDYNTSGKYTGVQPVISKEQQQAFYIHCFNLCLNLCNEKSSVTGRKITNEAPQGSKSHIKMTCVKGGNE